jgi:hypothetical protein
MLRFKLPPDIRVADPTHCRRRAERLRLALLCTADPVATARIRRLIEKYRNLAAYADKRIGASQVNSVEQGHPSRTEKANASVDYRSL